MEYDPEELARAVDRRVANLGFELVDVRKKESRGRTILQIRMDKEGSVPGRGVTAEDCASVSRALESWLDDSGLVGDRYVLEVSSPGVERPIRFLRHWRRYTGSDVRVRIRGRGRQTATIVKVQDDANVVLRFRNSSDERVVPLSEVEDATLVVDWSTLGRSLARNASKESQ